MILLSNEPSVRAVFEMAMGTHQRLVVATSHDELRAALDSPAETVVIDLPAEERVEAWERVRTLHAGMVLVAVDSQDETQEWPPDVARRFLVRPLHAEEIVAALAVRPRILREPAAARRRRLAQARRPPLVPPPSLAADQEPRAIEPVRRLSSEESLWEEPGDVAAPGTPAATTPAATTPAATTPAATTPAATTPAASMADATAAGTTADPELEPPTPSHAPAPPAPALDRPESSQPRAEPDHPFGRPSLLTLAVMLLLLVSAAVGGIAIGRATASPDHKAPGVATTPSTGSRASTPTTAAPGVVIKEKTPAACDAALADADAAVSYLVGNVRDQRLTQSMQRYQENRRACREASR